MAQQALLTRIGELEAREAELTRRIATNSSAIAENIASTQQAASLEDYDAAARFKSAYKILQEEKLASEAEFSTTCDLVVEARRELLQAKVKGIVVGFDPAALKKKSEEVYAAKVKTSMQEHEETLSLASLVMAYIIQNAAAEGVGVVHIGHFLSYQGFQKIFMKEMEMPVMKELGEDITTELEKTYGQGSCSVAVEEAGLHKKLVVHVPNQRHNWDLLKSSVLSTLGSRQTRDGYSIQLSGFTTEMINDRLIVQSFSSTEPLRKSLLRLYTADFPDIILSNYEDLFELYVSYDGRLSEGYTYADLVKVFPSGLELACLHQVLSNPALAQLFLFAFQQRGHNVTKTDYFKRSRDEFLAEYQNEKNSELLFMSAMPGRTQNCLQYSQVVQRNPAHKEQNCREAYKILTQTFVFDEPSVTQTHFQWNISDPLLGTAGEDLVQSAKKNIDFALKEISGDKYNPKLFKLPVKTTTTVAAVSCHLSSQTDILGRRDRSAQEEEAGAAAKKKKNEAMP